MICQDSKTSVVQAVPVSAALQRLASLADSQRPARYDAIEAVFRLAAVNFRAADYQWRNVYLEGGAQCLLLTYYPP